MEGNMERSKLNKILGANIKFLRRNTKVRNVVSNKFKYMTQKELAIYMGKNCEQQVSKFELGNNELSISQAYILSKLFGISVDSLFGDLTKSDYKKIINNDICIEQV
jgi:plasmid maintenance system antidote protein VapI